MIGMLLSFGVVIVGAIGLFAADARRRGGRFVIVPPNDKIRLDRPHRQAINHFALGMLPPWR